MNNSSYIISCKLLFQNGLHTKILRYILSNQFGEKLMSIECLNKALKIQFKNQTPTKRLILILLANYCDDANSCYPSYGHIAKLAGLKDTKHIASIVKEFEEIGLLRIEKRYKEDGGNTSNRYHLTIRGEDNPPTGVEATTPLASTPPNTKDYNKDDKKELMYDFKKFWSLYPRKENKHQAETKYKLVIKKYDQDKLIEMLTRFLNEIEAKNMDKKFIPHCSTWLNQKRYLDFEEYEMQEIISAKPKAESKDNWYDDLKLG